MLDTLSPVNPSMSYSKSNRKRYALSPASVNSPVLSKASPTHPSPCNNSSYVFIFLNLSFFFPLFGILQPEPLRVLRCRERPPDKPFPMFFPANYSCPGKEEFAGNPFQNGGNRRGSLHSHRRKPVR